VNKGSS